MDNVFEQAVEETALVAQAKTRYESTSAHQGALTNLYNTYMRYYDPPNGDQWPEDRLDPERADKIHMSVNFVKPVVDIESRLQSILPRLALTPNNADDPNERRVAEIVEKMHLSWLNDSAWDVWLGDQAKTRAIFGKTVWKPAWDDENNHPTVIPLERIENLRIGWAGNDFRKKDWALFEYTLSPTEVMARWDVKVMKGSPGNPLTVLRTTDHTDPLDTIPNWGATHRPSPTTTGSDGDIRDANWEQNQVKIWDYWYKKNRGIGKKKQLVCNAIIVEGVVVEQSEHPEYLDIPYIVIENDHRPGSPEGISSVKAIMNLQDQYNLALSLWAQTVYDNVDLAYQLVGETADDVEAGMVPHRGQIMPTGLNNRVEAIPTSQNQFPVQQLTVEYWAAMFRVSGFPEIMFGGVPGAQISGRALATQIEAVANRLDPKRRRLYHGIMELFRYWKFMVKAKRGTIEVPGEEGPVKIKISALLEKAGVWKIVAPELTPRDVVEVTQNAIQQVQAKFMNLTGAMDMIGNDSPEETLRRIIEERNNIDLYPGDVQIKAAVMATLQQMQMAQQQMMGTEGAVAGMQGAAAEGRIREMEGQPTLDEEAGGVASTAGEPGGAPLGGTAQTLIRPDTETGQAEALQQMALRRDV